MKSFISQIIITIGLIEIFHISIKAHLYWAIYLEALILGGLIIFLEFKIAKRVFDSSIYLSLNKKMNSNVILVNIIWGTFLCLLFQNEKSISLCILILYFSVLITVYVKRKYQYKIFMLMNEELLVNGLYVRKVKLNQLTAIKFYPLGDYLHLKFKHSSGVTIDRTQFENNEIIAFITEILKQCSQPINISQEAKSKLNMS